LQPCTISGKPLSRYRLHLFLPACSDKISIAVTSSFKSALDLLNCALLVLSMGRRLQLSLLERIATRATGCGTAASLADLASSGSRQAGAHVQLAAPTFRGGRPQPSVHIARSFDGFFVHHLSHLCHKLGTLHASIWAGGATSRPIPLHTASAAKTPHVFSCCSIEMHLQSSESIDPHVDTSTSSRLRARC
jgi:hypothetical protein